MHAHESLAAADRVVERLLAVGGDRRGLVGPGLVRSPVVSKTKASHWPISSGSNNRPSLDATTSNPCSLPISVKICSARPSLSPLRAITECWKPELLVKKRTFLAVPLGGPVTLSHRRRPPATPLRRPATIDDDSGPMTSRLPPFEGGSSEENPRSAHRRVRPEQHPIDSFFYPSGRAKETGKTARSRRFAPRVATRASAFRLRTWNETINVTRTGAIRRRWMD